MSQEESEFRVPKMDCAAEERLVRAALEGRPEIGALTFDLPERRVRVRHAAGMAEAVLERLEGLGLGAEPIGTRPLPVGAPDLPVPDAAAEARTLWTLLAINAVMFVVEFGAGLALESAGLLADSLDMLADASVYGVSLYAVGRLRSSQLRAAHSSGLLQGALAIGALAEVARRVLVPSDPEPGWMMGVAAVALAANIACLVLIFRHRSGGAHMKASYIFSANDVIANAGVIIAGGLVALTGSRYPDLVIGAAIGLLVLSGAVRILRIRDRAGSSLSR